jgi:two-component system, OmpR family, phosphate regulon sensor histidine kinase PhoR
MIRNPTPRVVSLITSALLSFCIGIIALVVTHMNWVDTFFIFSASWLLSFFLVYYALEFFIYRKIKLIYKTIHSLKTQRYSGVNALLKKIDHNSDPISEVNQEVITWARDKKEEIDQLKKLADFRKEFIGNVSHELKTPIFNIQGYIHTLIDGALEDPEVNMKFLRKAARGADRLCDLVEDLISISQLEAGELQMEYERFDINSLVKDVYEQLEYRSKEKGITLAIKDGCNVPFYVYADKYRIRQVIVNLVVNSIKYGREMGVTTAAYYDMDENILIEITDNGDGIEQEHLPRLFERFYRVDKSRSRDAGGTGLGLAIVKHILEAHKQGINVRSTVGVGSTFSFTLKKAQAAERMLTLMW